MKLERDTIIDVAFTVLDEGGLDKLNMRAVAMKLSVSATALYWHFRDKDALLSAMGGRLYAAAFACLEGHSDWREALMDFGSGFQQALNSHRDGALLCGISNPLAVEDEVRIASTKPLERYGLDVATAFSYEAVVISFVLGWSIYNQNSVSYSHLSRLFDFDSTFHLGLKAAVDGLAAQHGS